MWRGMDTFTEATGMEPSSVPLWSAAAGLLQRRGAEVQLRASNGDQETLKAGNGLRIWLPVDGDDRYQTFRGKPECDRTVNPSLVWCPRTRPG